MVHGIVPGPWRLCHFERGEFLARPFECKGRDRTSTSYRAFAIQLFTASFLDPIPIPSTLEKHHLPNPLRNRDEGEARDIIVVLLAHVG